MALLLPHSIYFHTPRTAGSATREALKNAGLAVAEARCKGHVENDQLIRATCCTHNTINDIHPSLLENRFSFSFVRHPLTYYQSVWCLRTFYGWKRNSRIDTQFGATTFSQYLENVLTYSPGYISKYYERAFAQQAQVDFIGKFEHFTQNLIFALEQAGEIFDSAAIHALDIINPGKDRTKMHERCHYTRELHERVCEAEKSALIRFGYSSEDVPWYEQDQVEQADRQYAGALKWQ